MALSVFRVFFQIPLVPILAIGYTVVLVLSSTVSRTLAGVAFDAAGVTTGPVTVPVVLALGLGLSSVIRGRDPLIDGFGIIALASMGPIIAVLLLGWILRL